MCFSVTASRTLSLKEDEYRVHLADQYLCIPTARAHTGQRHTPRPRHSHWSADTVTSRRRTSTTRTLGCPCRVRRMRARPERGRNPPGCQRTGRARSRAWE